jgi:hypothetical protein
MNSSTQALDENWHCIDNLPIVGGHKDFGNLRTGIHGTTSVQSAALLDVVLRSVKKGGLRIDFFT